MSAVVLVACWGGERRREHAAYQQDRALYLRQWNHALSRLSCESEVVFISNGGEDSYCEYLDSLRKRYKVADRENRGFSQGAWHEGYHDNLGHDFYILVEDDFIPVFDGFDQAMINAIQHAPGDCGFLCQLVSKTFEGTPFPSMQNGIINSRCLRTFKGLPWSAATEFYNQADQAQVKFGEVMNLYGFGVYDMGRQFKAPYTEGDGSVIIYHDAAPDTLFVPSEIYEMIWKVS